MFDIISNIKAIVKTIPDEHMACFIVKSFSLLKISSINQIHNHVAPILGVTPNIKLIIELSIDKPLKKFVAT